MNYKRIYEQKKTRRLFWLRYLCPSVGLLLLLIAMQLPCLQYSTAATGENQALSTAQLLRNSWNEVREYLFGGAEQISVTLAFSRVVLVTLALCLLCFLLGTAATVWITVGAFCYLRRPQDTGFARILWITLFPNRFVCCLYFALLLPLLAFPRMLIPIYANMLGSAVTLKSSPWEPLWLGLLLLVGISILSAYCANRERACDLSPFEKDKRAEEDEEDASSDESSELCDPAEAEQTRKAREEQLLRIRALLNTRSDDDQKPLS